MTAEVSSKTNGEGAKAKPAGYRIGAYADASMAANRANPASRPTGNGVKQSAFDFFWAPGVSTAIPAYLSIAAIRIALTAYLLGLLAGVVLPRALDAVSSTLLVAAKTSNPQVSFASAVRDSRLHLYLLAWTTFHMLEFLITAQYNATRLFSDSFLISNGLTYHMAHLFGIAEFILTTTFLHAKSSISWYSMCGFIMMIVGQFIRSTAMAQAAGNFSHEVAIKKREDHMLVTDGIYRFFRHPSYAGFFYWALGTQILLGNPVSSVVFALVLWRFFFLRIKDEERYLISFFGQPYVEFKARTRTWIPFVP